MSDTPLDPMSEFGLATAKAVRLAAAEAGCCADDSWRGHLCPYHQGVEDGMDAVLHVISPDLVVAALIEAGWRPDDDQLRAVILAAGEQTCPLCMGDGCEWGCRRCRYANVGPDSHRVCRRCQGRGTVKGADDAE